MEQETKLTEDQLEMLNLIDEKRDSLMQTIESLSLSVSRSKKKFWDSVDEWYPDLKVKESIYRFDRERGVLIKL